MVAVTVVAAWPFIACPALPTKNTRWPVAALVEPPLTVMLFAPPSMRVLLPRISGNSLRPELPMVIVPFASVFAKVIIVPGLPLAWMIASRSDRLLPALSVSANVLTTH